MNRIIITIFFYLVSLSLISQNITDALNYTNNNIDGSARFSSMAGSFGALGGEISSISANPAGSAIFNDSNTVKENVNLLKEKIKSIILK